MIINDIANFLPRLWNGTSIADAAAIPADFIEFVLHTPDLSLQYANSLVGTLPGQRYAYYTNSNFEEMKRDVLSELNKIDEALGFFNTISQPVLIEALELYNYALLFIGLIFNVLLIIFVVVATLLVFSLLLISVESKAFEFGVMRLVGLTRLGFISMIFTQAGMFVLPAVTAAFALSFPLIYVLFSTISSNDLGYMPSVAPSGQATLNALFIGVLIPLLSSIVPIKRGLNANLTETLDTSRSKTKGAIITISDAKAINVAPYLLFGTISVVLGIVVYYGLPQAMLKLNLGMILSIFFLLLMGMLLGLVLASLNLQPALERLLLHVFFFWEKNSMRTILKKNMIAHRAKNKLTSIIYALSLGSIIFLLTSANMQINMIVSDSALAGSDISIDAWRLHASDVDDILYEYSDDIAE